MLQRPAWPGGGLAAGTRADGPKALSKLATAESVATGKAAFKYVISLGVALLMYSGILVLRYYDALPDSSVWIGGGGR